MAKKKKAKSTDLNKSLNRWVNQNQTVLAFIGGLTGGAALALSINSPKGQELFSELSNNVKTLLNANSETADEKKEKTKIKKNVSTPVTTS